MDREDSQRTRRASDVLLLVASVIALALLSLVALPPSGFESGLAHVLAAVPAVLDGVWRLLIGLAWWWAGLIVAAILLRKRWALLRDVILAVTLAAGLALVIGRLVSGAWALVWEVPSPTGGTNPWVPLLRLTLPIAAISAASPFLIQAFRRCGRWLVLGAILGALVVSTTPNLVVASAVIALMATSSVHLLVGSTMGWPRVEDVALGLDALGVAARSLRVVDRQSAGVFRMEATGADGESLDVKVYGRDAADTQFLTTLWRRLFYRGLGDQFTTGRLHQVEHEAYLTLLAHRVGLADQQVMIGGLTPTGDAILVLRNQIEDPDSGHWSEDDARLLWDSIQRLHNTGIAHNHIETSTVVRTDKGFRFRDFRLAAAGPDPWRLTFDRIQALVLTAIELGPDTAISVARDTLGNEELTNLLPLFQPEVVSGESRAMIRSGAFDIDELRDATAQALEIDPPELERLRRVTPGSILKAALPLLAFFALAAVVAGFDLAELADSLVDASWWFIAVAFVLAQVPRIGQALSAMGASPIPLPLGRLYILQLAQGFIALTIPTAAARIATNIRFLQRHGLPGGTAVVSGALDGFAGFVAQVILLVGILSFSSFSLDLDLGSDVSSGLVNLVGIVALVAVAVVGAALAVPHWRKPLLGRLKHYLADAREAIRGLGTPRRLGLLLGGNLLTETLMAVALWVFVAALGYPVGLPELILIHVAVSLLAGFLPVPGGIGVFEAGLVLGLTRAGIPEEAAFAAAILFRSATYYLPPIWGYVAFRWLERNKYL